MSNIKIFIASSAELEEDRKASALLIDELNKTYPLLNLEHVTYELDTPSGNAPAHKDLQDAINTKLYESEVVIFLFYTKLGKYTLQELDVALDRKKKVFVYFKNGFTPRNNEEEEKYNDLIALRKRFNEEGKIRCQDYNDTKEYYGKLLMDLHKYISGTHKAALDIPGMKMAVKNGGDGNITLIESKVENINSQIRK